MLSFYPEFNVVATAGDGLEAIRRVETHQPELLLIDLSMPRMSGMDAIRDIKRRFPQTRIVALTVHKTDEYILATLQAGADAYVLKDACQEELILAIRTVLGGHPYLSPGISQTVIEGYLDRKREGVPVTAYDSLSAREKEILKFIAEGFKNREIAELLCISLKTVEKHRANLMKKLDLHNTAALTTLALEKGLVTP
jgi:DNA-binding NarL/FixJ family response regulator